MSFSEVKIKESKSTSVFKEVKLREQSGVPYLGGGMDPDPDAHLWRNLTNRKDRSLPPSIQAKQANIAAYLSMTNPIAHRALEYKKDYIVGGGMKIKAKDPIVHKILDEHWNDPVNTWQIN